MMSHSWSYGSTLLLALIAFSPLQAEETAHLVPRALLIEDARQLLDTIEEAHPDPHLAGGGRIAFHRRFHQMLNSIPAEGLPTEEFIRLLQPLIASIGDSHTGIRMKSGNLDPLFLPLTMRIVEHDLVVEQVADPKLEPLLGARLVSIEGVSIQELLNRQGAIRGMENRYGHLVLFNLRALATRQGLQQLLPEWQGNNTIRVEVIQRTGEALTTETIADLVRQMAAAGTRNLIVDLRGNTGGNSALREILVYLLYGDAAMLSLDNGYQIVKLSRLLFEQYDTFSLEQVNEGQPFPLGPTDYDFRDETSYRQPQLAGEAPEEPFLAASPSFWDLYQTKEFHEPKWTSPRVLVLSSPSTFSSGFNVLTGLYAMGARVVGTASAQPGNNFGDVLQFQLKNTGLEAFVSHKQNITFPDDPEMGRCLQPHYPLTLEKLAAYDFDPNAEILMALEVLGANF